MAFNGPGPGRPKGGLNRTTKEIRDLARNLLDDPDYKASLRTRLLAGVAPHIETLLWHYAYGKPKETVELQGEVGVTKIVREIVRAQDAQIIDTTSNEVPESNLLNSDNSSDAYH